MTQLSSILESRFYEVLSKDKRFAPSWLVDWNYQKILKKRKVQYEDGVVSDFFEFKGQEELVRWMNWFTSDYPDYMKTPEVLSLIEKSRKNDQRVLESFDLNYDFSNYDLRVGINNAHDFLLPQIYPVPERNRIHTVLDFGAGYGRQANLWTSERNDVCYIGMDAIVTSYCLQNLYYKSLGKDRFQDYVEQPESFRFDPKQAGLWHIPTWRTDLIPDASLDLVMCVQVLPELSPRLVRHMIRQFARVLKPGGAFYIRDHAYTWKPTGGFDVEEFIQSQGFVLEYKAYIINNKDIHGIPRIWRKKDPLVEAAQTQTFKMIAKQFAEDIDTYTGGRLRKTIQKLKKKK
ncbi:MAG: class I SAM-dependent methyltransferase [Bacteroidia bacterium]